MIEFGKTKDIGLQHDLLKYIFGTILFKDKGQFEKKEDGKTVDIYSILEELRVEVKTIVFDTVIFS